MKTGVIGTGQFARSSPCGIHPDVAGGYVTDLVPERAAEQVERHRLAGSFATIEEMLAFRCRLRRRHDSTPESRSDCAAGARRRRGPDRPSGGE